MNLPYIDEDLLATLHLDAVSPSVREKTLTDLGEQVFTRITAAFMDLLSPDIVAKYIDLMKEKGEKAALEYVATELPDAEKIARKVACDTVEEFKQLVAV